MLKIDARPKNIVQRIYKKVYRELRDLKRNKIRAEFMQLPAAPKYIGQVDDVEIHMLICNRDLDMGICAAKSLVMSSQAAQNFVFHDDGTLTTKDRDRLMYHFPGTRLISNEEGVRKAFEKLDPLTYSFRSKGVMLLKLVDIVLFAQSSKVILMDSDVLFFDYPEELFEVSERNNLGNYFNKDIESAYMLPAEKLEALIGARLLPRLNAGLSVLNVDSISLDKISQWLKRLENEDIIWHRVEQTLIAMLSATYHSSPEHLSVGYDVAYFKSVEKSVCKHYVGKIRHGFELEGLKFLLTRRGFKNRWKVFVDQHNEV